ncbi:MAG: thiol reductase thioredoxin [Phycisphaerales bacterium]|nr:thiol reductase thioredoxin [Phycisphaerales bacterium]
MLEFTDENFDAEVLRAPVPVLVDFGADYCPPCKALEPTISELAAEYSGKARVGQYDFASSPMRAAGLGVTSLPTILVFNGGKVVQKFVGVTGKKDLAAAIDSALG